MAGTEDQPVDPDLLEEFFLEKDIDGVDIVLAMQHMIREEETREFSRSFSLEDYTDSQCWEQFRFQKQDIL